MKIKILIIAGIFILNSSFLIQNSFAQWGQDIRLTNNPYSSYLPSISVYGLNMHVVWYDWRDGNPEIYYKRSTDGGMNWGTDTRLTNAPGISEIPSIAVTASNVHVIWHDYRDGNSEIYYKHSTDGGITWGVDTRLTNDTANSLNTSISVSATNVHATWHDYRDGNSEIYYKCSTDDGLTWGVDTRLTNNTAYSLYPSIEVTGSMVNVVWYDTRDGNAEIYYKRSTDGGTTWGSDIRLTNNSEESYRPSIAVYGSNVNVVWEDIRDGDWEIYFKHSTDGGINWGTDTRLTNSYANSRTPSIANSGSNVHVVWYDDRDGNNEIYYKLSTTGGVTWKEDTRLTNNSAGSYVPSIAVFGSFVHLLWYDGRDGNSEIYYKCNPTGNVGIQNISTEIPFAFSVEQNYPNPFNPVTNIQFKVSIYNFINLCVFDISGKEIAVLVNEMLRPGTYETTFDASSLAGGVYFYRLKTGDNKTFITKKMILLK